MRRSPQPPRTRSKLSDSTMTLLVVLGLAVLAQAQTFTTLYNFTGGSDGRYPKAGLIRDSTGNLYGTTADGGNSGGCYPFGCGVVFRLDTRGNETVLHAFDGYPSDGAYSTATVVRDRLGNLYGTTQWGGSSSHGCGVVFKIDTGGIETVLHNFQGKPTDGCYPWGGLILDKSGNVYGTTMNGGARDAGTVFKISKGGKETILHSFMGRPNDGDLPGYGNLAMDRSGNLYGVAAGGSAGWGVVYRLTKSGVLILLHSFTRTGGSNPLGTLIMNGSGNLYGTTEDGGNSNYGTMWEMGKTAPERLLHSFANDATDGGYPFAGVARDPGGNLYGDTGAGGLYSCGTVYELNPSGTLTLLHSFTCADGETPYGAVLRDGKGRLYGTTVYGGAYGYGTVWSYVP